jgi:hypothetical protein
MATKSEKQYGQCPNHGQVAATREIPGVTFPFILYGIRRYRARKQPFVCPTCGSPVDAS